MNAEEREFWKAAYLAALPSVIRMPWTTDGTPGSQNAELFARMAACIADDSVYRLQELAERHAPDPR